jgi:predicted Fe-Mo cluster-binding NifX family protein
MRSVDVVQLLLDYGADVAILNKAGQSALETVKYWLAKEEDAQRIASYQQIIQLLEEAELKRKRQVL